MTLANYNSMSLDELRQYVLHHREDIKAFQTYIDRSKSTGRMITIDPSDPEWEENLEQKISQTNSDLKKSKLPAMTQAQFNLEESEIEFLDRCQEYGFNNRDELIRVALSKLRQELETRSLEESVDLYAEIYEQDQQLQELTELALLDMPE